MLGWIGGVARSFELTDVGLPLRRISSDGADRLQIAHTYRVREIDRRPLVLQ